VPGCGAEEKKWERGVREVGGGGGERSGEGERSWRGVGVKDIRK
jgi:hypothetical protein